MIVACLNFNDHMKRFCRSCSFFGKTKCEEYVARSLIYIERLDLQKASLTFFPVGY